MPCSSGAAGLGAAVCLRGQSVQRSCHLGRGLYELLQAIVNGRERRWCCHDSSVQPVQGTQRRKRRKRRGSLLLQGLSWPTSGCLVIVGQWGLASGDSRHYAIHSTNAAADSRDATTSFLR